METQHLAEPHKPKIAKRSAIKKQHDDHTNSARAGDDTENTVGPEANSAGSIDSQHADTRKLDTEPDRAR